MRDSYRFAFVLVSISLGLATGHARAALIQFSNSDFGLDPIFSNVQIFSFTIDIADELTAGTTYTNPSLNGVNYNVRGTLDQTPSGFPAFSLRRDIDGDDFYTQGGSLSFEITADANLADGLQANELVADGDGRIFNFNAREFMQTPARYHPSLVELFSDGSGRIQNSNNMGPVGAPNPDSGLDVDVDFGEEYITDLSFSSASLSLAAPKIVATVVVVPVLSYLLSE